MTHTAGLVYGFADLDVLKWAKYVNRTLTPYPSTEEEWSAPLKYAPGDDWQYGCGVDVAGLAIEKVTGMTLGAFTEKHIFAPLGMRDTTFRPLTLEEQTRGRQSDTVYRDYSNGGLVPGLPLLPPDPPADYGGAGAYTTATDYSKVLKALLTGGAPLLSRESVDEIFRPQTTDVQRAELQDFISKGYTLSDPPEFPPGMRFDHGLAGIINLDDSPEKRLKDSLRWGGAVNSVWVSKLRDGRLESCWLSLTTLG